MNKRRIKNRYTNTDDTVDICEALALFNIVTAIF